MLSGLIEYKHLMWFCQNATVVFCHFQWFYGDCVFPFFYVGHNLAASYRAMRILRFHGLIQSIIIISSITIIVVDFLLATSLTLGHGFPDHIQLPVLALPAPAAGSQPNLQLAVPQKRAGWWLERKE